MSLYTTAELLAMPEATIYTPDWPTIDCCRCRITPVPVHNGLVCVAFEPRPDSQGPHQYTYLPPENVLATVDPDVIQKYRAEQQQ
jgi:hypothetical protein